MSEDKKAVGRPAHTGRAKKQITREIFLDQFNELENVYQETGKSSTEQLREILDKHFKLPKKA